jgi:hypothetical protein
MALIGQDNRALPGPQGRLGKDGVWVARRAPLSGTVAAPRPAPAEKPAAPTLTCRLNAAGRGHTWGAVGAGGTAREKVTCVRSSAPWMSPKLKLFLGRRRPSPPDLQDPKYPQLQGHRRGVRLHGCRRTPASPSVPRGQCGISPGPHTVARSFLVWSHRSCAKSAYRFDQGTIHQRFQDLVPEWVAAVPAGAVGFRPPVTKVPEPGELPCSSH